MSYFPYFFSSSFQSDIFSFSVKGFNKSKFNLGKQAKFHLPASFCKQVLDTRIFLNNYKQNKILRQIFDRNHIDP